MIGAVSASQGWYLNRIPQAAGSKAYQSQFDTSTVVSTGSAPPRMRISRTG
jgi:hypothetical protein